MSFAALLDLVYPRACGACGGRVAESSRHVCWDCRSDIHMISAPFCSVCGNPVEGRVDHAYVCYHCSEKMPFFDRARSAARYEGVAQKLILDFKYHQALWLEADLVELLVASAHVHLDFDQLDGITYVPLHHVRRRERGYNQAELLAHALARQLHKPLLSGCLNRVRPTRTQTHLTAPQRAHNVKDAFAVQRTDEVKGRHILCVDDVMTTGATLSECARALKEAGARTVETLTLARGG